MILKVLISVGVKFYLKHEIKYSFNRKLNSISLKNNLQEAKFDNQF